MILKSERIIQHIISIKYNLIINHMMVLNLYRTLYQKLLKQYQYEEAIV